MPSTSPAAVGAEARGLVEGAVEQLEALRLRLEGVEGDEGLRGALAAALRAELELRCVRSFG